MVPAHPYDGIRSGETAPVAHRTRLLTTPIALFINGIETATKFSVLFETVFVPFVADLLPVGKSQGLYSSHRLRETYGRHA